MVIVPIFVLIYAVIFALFSIVLICARLGKFRAAPSLPMS